MELPIDDKDLEIIVSALSLGGDARLYHLLKGVKEDRKLRIIFFLMDLPINDKDLETIVRALSLGGDSRLYFLLKQVKEVRDENPDGPYKKILREEKGMVI